MYDIISLDGKELPEIKEIARQLNIPKVDRLTKQELIYKILDYQALNPPRNCLMKRKNLREKNSVLKDNVRPFQDQGQTRFLLLNHCQR